jgi:hypothetical protein
MKIYDCFPFFREENLLELRLRLLWNFVDYFCIVEAGETHTGLAKDALLPKFFSSHPEYLEKVRYLFIEKFPREASEWSRENTQRIALDRLINDAEKSDWILTSDIDEIPNPVALHSLRITNASASFLHFRQYHCYFRYNYVQVAHVPISKDPFWYGTVAHKRALNLNSQHVRELRWPGSVSRATCGIVQNGGWHFSYLGSDSDYQIKLRSIAEHNLPFVLAARGHSIESLIRSRACPFNPAANIWAVLAPTSMFPEPVLNILLTHPQLMITTETDDPTSILGRIRMASALSDNDK